MEDSKDISMSDLELSLKLLPPAIYKAGQDVIIAEGEVAIAERKLRLAKADIIIGHKDDKMAPKLLDAYCVKGTGDAETVLMLANSKLEQAKLHKELLENKYGSVKKISNLRGIYQGP